MFQECFRPLSASFKSRLESVCSSNPSSPIEGSLEGVCSIFESTLKFLALVYEAIAGSWIDIVEAGVLKAETGATVYKSILESFLLVAAPFAPYQERLSQLEATYSARLSRRVARDIERAVALENSSVETLQLAIERLQDLGGSYFSIAAGAVSRVELLTGGYSATQCLSTIDSVLTDNADQLALAVHSLSNKLLSDAFADNFDDTHVLCALEILKVAGDLHRNCIALEENARERLRLLADRQSLCASREIEVSEAASSGPTASKGLRFDLPDAMSAVEIDSFITRKICGQGGKTDIEASVLSFDRPGGDDERVFTHVYEAKERLAASCQSFIFGVLVAVPRRHLQNMSTLSSWRENVSNDELSYGTLPQQYITLVGEHVLALVQALEPFTSNQESLALVTEAMIGVRDVALPMWRDFMAACNCSLDQNDLRALMCGRDLADRLLSIAPADDEDIEDHGLDEHAEASAAFCNSWLDAVCLAVTGQLLERITRIPSLSAKGCEHLSADLDYLVNVFSALGLQAHPHPLLFHCAHLAVMDSSALEDRISTFDRSDAAACALNAFEARFAAIRGGAENN